MNTTHSQPIHADPKISRFNPLSRIIFHDDFDEGLCGWTKVIGNYEDSLDNMLPQYREWRPPMLSNLTVWDTGTTGSLDGNYAMKLATLPQASNISIGVKRLTRRHHGPIRMEYYFSFKPEPSELRLSDKFVRAMGFGFDLQQSDRTGPGAQRVHPIIRYLNCWQGERVQRWQYKDSYNPFHQIGETGETVSFYPWSSENWKDLPDGEQRLCYNELPTKINWYYLCLDFDTAAMSYTRLQCNDRVFDLSGIEAIKIPAMPNLWCMTQPFVYVEADAERRVFGYVDSALFSAEGW